jgi:Acyl-CoA reductase (LuxC)
MDKICQKLDLLHNCENVIRVPFLVKGRIIAPPEMTKREIEAAFTFEKSEHPGYVKLPGAQILREPMIDRRTMKHSGKYIYQVMPTVLAQDLVEPDTTKLADELYGLSVEAILDYLNTVSRKLMENAGLAKSVLETSRLATELPGSFFDGWATSMATALDRGQAKQMIDAELSLWGKPGSEFLDGWVEVLSKIVPPTTYGVTYPADHPSQSKSLIRAMPTRQLHITAGNEPEVPAVSLLRAILTKSAAVIKLPSGATLAGSMLGIAMATLPDHPITQNISLVYWCGGDDSIENPLFEFGAFDRIVLWGGHDAVADVRARAPYTSIVSFNPRYGVSLIGREAFHEGLEETARRAAADSMIYNQKSCTASLVHYIEASEEQTELYSEALRKVLEEWDHRIPQFLSPHTRGQIKMMKRGKYANASWHVNEREGEFTSGVVVMEGGFDILDHPMCRLVTVRRVDNLGDTLRYLHQGVSTVGVYPESRRLALRDAILARGVSNVFPLGQCERKFAGMPHDGIPVLSHLVDWKNS